MVLAGGAVGEQGEAPEARAGAVADCCRGASLSSFGGASEKRRTSSGRPRGPGQVPPALAASGVRSRTRLCGLEEGPGPGGGWLPVSLLPTVMGPTSFCGGHSCLQASGPLARRRSAEARLKARLRDALRLAGSAACRGLPRLRLCGGWTWRGGALGEAGVSTDDRKLGFTYCPGFGCRASGVLTAILMVGATKLVGILAPSFLGGSPGWLPTAGESLALRK